MNSVDQTTLPPVEPLERVVDLIDIAGKMKASTVVVVGGYRSDDLRLVESARDHGIVDRVLLIGPKDRIAQAVDEVGIHVDPKDIVEADNDVDVARAAVKLIQAGGLDIVLKGGISTPIINRHMLPLAIRPTVSLATVFDTPCVRKGRPILLTDAGVTTICNFGRLADMIHNALDVAHTVMGLARPRVAILSANEKQIPSLPSTWIGLELARRTWNGALVCGPLSFDLATDPESVAIKGMPDLPNAAEVAGQADVLICPGIDTANALYKFLTALNKYGEASLASITMGFPVPYIILSRADSVETRLVSLAICAVYSQRKAAGLTAFAPDAQTPAPAATPAGRPPQPGANDPAAAGAILAAAQQAGREAGRPWEELALVVAHLDREITVAGVREGRILDHSVIPPPPQAATGQEGDAQADYRVAKEIGQMFVACGCDVEGIVLTGPQAGSDWARSALRRRVLRLAPVFVIEQPSSATA